MGFSDNMKDSVYAHYSPSHLYSFGIESKKDKYTQSDYSYLRFTYLLDRKNTEKSQRNFYFQSGINPDGTNNCLKTQTYQDKFFQLGIAPYLGEYGDLHTWLMVKAKKNSIDNDWSVYPMLKLFRGDFLVEIGYNKKTNVDAHLMYRF
jgi:hypothetical protein